VAGAHGLTTGFYDGAFSGDAGGDRLDEAASLGAGAIRIAVSWPGIAPTRPARPADPADGAYDWVALDAAVAQVETRGLDVLLAIDQTPGWAQGRNRPRRYSGNYKPNARAVGAFATAVARRYAGSASAVQLFNEPNLDIYLAPQWKRTGRHFTPFAPIRYRAMLNAAYPGVHAAGLKLVTAGTAPYGDPGRGGSRMRPLLFWKAVLRKKTRFDILAHHPYSVGGPRRHALSRNDIALPDVHRLVRLVRGAVARGTALPHRRKRFWVTELSWDSRPPDPHGVPLRRLTRWVSDSLYVLWRQGVDRVVWFQVRDQPRGPRYASTYQSGMFTVDGTPKPSSRAFAFPFACERRGTGTRVWLRAPDATPVTVTDTAGRARKRLSPGADRVAVATIAGHGRLRAVSQHLSSPVCRS
jgi:hypothetical protein